MYTSDNPHYIEILKITPNNLVHKAGFFFPLIILFRHAVIIEMATKIILTNFPAAFLVVRAFWSAWRAVITVMIANL